MKRVMMTVVTAAAVVSAAAPAMAVQNDDRAVSVATAPPDVDKARELRAQAEALFSEPRQWRKAARLLEQSAALRDASDADGYTCLLYAGRIRAALGDLTSARQNLEKAATQALMRGALVEAAHAYIDAAFVAAEAREVESARAFMERAKLLSDAPLLNAEQKLSLMVRLAA